MAGNQFPIPNGVTASFSKLLNGVATPNFSFGEAGRYAVVWNAQPDALNAGVKLVLQQVVGSTTTALLTMTVPGRYDLVLGTGGGTFNFLGTATGGVVGEAGHVVSRASMTQVDPMQRPVP